MTSTALRPVINLAEILRWQVAGRRGPTPHIVKERIVRDFARRYGLKVLVETGTYLGDMVWAVRDQFEEIHSIELDAALFKQAQARFRGQSQVHLHLGDSAQVLGDITKTLHRPALIWLDGHYSGGITAKGSTDTPIRDELASLLKPSAPDHVILIDDARLFTGDGDYPRIDELRRQVVDAKPHLRVSVEDDVIRIVSEQARPGSARPNVRR